MFFALWILLLAALHLVGFPSAEARPQSIKVVMDNNYPPYVFYDGAGKLQGILIDQWRLWEQKTGIPVKIHAMEWGLAISGMKAGEFDVIDGIFKTEERSGWLDFSRPYADIEVPIFFDKNISGVTDPTSLKGFPVSTKTGDAAVDLLKRNGVDNLMLFNSYEDIILAAKEHKVSVFVVDAPPALYFLYKFGIHDHFKQSAPLTIGRFHRAVKKENSVLLKVVEDGFGQIPADELKKIETKWYGAALHGSRLPRHLLIIIGSLALLAFIFFAWNRVLRKTVATRTAELKTSVKELQTLSVRQDAILTAVPDIIMEVDSNQVYTWANLAGLAFFGEDVVGKKAASYLEGQLNSYDTVQPLFEGTATVLYVESWQRRKDGEKRLLAWWCKELKDDQGNITGAISTARDITERKQVENALRESEKKYRLIADNTADTIWIMNMNMCFTYVSPSVKQMYGSTVEEVVGQTIDQSMTPESFQAVTNAFMEEMALEASGTADPRRIRVMELEEYKKDRSTIWVESSMSFLRDENQKPVGILGVSRDITDRKQAEEALQANRRQLQDIIEFLPDATLAVDKEKRVIIWNKEIEKMTGVPAAEMIGKGDYVYTIPFYGEARPQLMDLIFMDDVEVMARYPNMIREGDSLVAEVFCNALYNNKGAWVFVKASPLHDQSGNIIGAIERIRDITEHMRADEERARLEIQLQQAQKFEAIGTLAGGIAHDFNNLLMGIQGRASLLSSNLETSHPYREHIHAIEEYIRSASNLTKQLLGFAQGGKYEVKPIDMSELVLSSSAMFGRTKKEIQIHTRCEKSSLVVEADRGQIEQVLLNMYINAWQAMPPDGGKLYLETRIVMLDMAYCKPHQTEPGCYVKVSITDTGTGMDEVTRLRIFDPFFTTKEKSRGTGMGLASAYGIIKNHGGMITVYSEIGHGTTFNIYLPVSDKEAHWEAPQEDGLIKGSATILLVDDEDIIIDVGQAMLESLGYRVMTCKGGPDAVKLIEDTGNKIDMMILDLIMPGMDGGTAFDRIREIQPNIPVLLSSGYAINGHAEKIMGRGCNGFIQKPYNISELSQKIRKVLDEAKSPTQQ